MQSQLKSNFPHRLNRNGSFDSICTVCLATIASVSVEEELNQHEQNHICNPARLNQLNQYSYQSNLKDLPR